MQKGFVFSLIFAAIVAIFALANADKVAIDLLFTEVQISQAIVIFISTILGAVIMALLGMVRTFKSKREIKESNKLIEQLKEEVVNLKLLVENRGEEIQDLNAQIKEMQEEKLKEMESLDMDILE